MKVDGAVHGSFVSSFPRGLDSLAFQAAVAEVAAATGTDAAAGVFSPAASYPYVLAEILDLSAVEPADPETSQCDGETPPAASISLQESSIKDKLHELFEDGNNGWYTSNQLNKAVAAVDTAGSAVPQTRTVTVMVDGQSITVRFRGEGAPQLSAADVAPPGQSWQGKSFAMHPKGQGQYGIAPIVSLNVDGKTRPALWMGQAPPPSVVQAGSPYHYVYQASPDNPVSGLRSGEYVIIPAMAGGSPRPAGKPSADFSYDPPTGTVKLRIDGKAVTAQFWGEGPPRLNSSDIWIPGRPWTGQSFALDVTGKGTYRIMPLLPISQDGELILVQWAGPDIPRSGTDLPKADDKYYKLRIISPYQSATEPGLAIVEPRKLGEHLRPNTAAPAPGSPTASAPEKAPVTPSPDDFAYSPLTGLVTMKLGDQTINAYFVDENGSPPTSARQIQVEGEPWQEGQLYTLHKTSPQGRLFFKDYIIVPRDSNSTEVSALRPATVRPFDAVPLDTDEIVVLKTIFTPKIEDFVRLRSGVTSSLEVIAAKLSGALSNKEMEVLQRRHGTEFKQINLIDNGGTHYLIQGGERSVFTILGPNVRMKQHTHPDNSSGLLSASGADYRNLQMHSELTGQRSAMIVPLNQPAFPYKTEYAGPFKVNYRAQTVELEFPSKLATALAQIMELEINGNLVKVLAQTVEMEVNGKLVTVPVLKRAQTPTPSVAEIQMPGDPWYGQAYQMYADLKGTYFIVGRDYWSVKDPADFSPSEWLPRDTVIVLLRDGERVKARFSDDVVTAVRAGGDMPARDNIRPPGAEDRKEPYRLYQDPGSREWLIGLNNLNTEYSPNFKYDSETGAVSVIVDGQWVTAPFRGEKPQDLSAFDVAEPHQSWQRRSFAIYPEAGGYGIAPVVSLPVADATVLALWIGPGSPPSAADLQAGSYDIRQATPKTPLSGLTNGEYVIIPADSSLGRGRDEPPLTPPS